MKKLFLVTFAFNIVMTSWADLKVTDITDSSLPYELSPSNYENSPSNYKNSVTNYENSPSNYVNSESNYNNSVTNYANGDTSKHRILLENDGDQKRYGYYVHADNGVTNFFSNKGKRLFYNPTEGSGIYHGKKGKFCGVLAVSDDELVLGLNKTGKKVLLISQ